MSRVIASARCSGENACGHFSGGGPAVAEVIEVSKLTITQNHDTPESDRDLLPIALKSRINTMVRV